jgi:hypothetical protein
MMPTYTPLTVASDLVLRPIANRADTHDAYVQVPSTVRSTDRTAVAVAQDTTATARGEALHCRRHGVHDPTCLSCVLIHGGTVVEAPIRPGGPATIVEIVPARDRPSAVTTSVVAASPAAPSTPLPVTLWPDPCPTFTYLAGAAGSGKTYATREWAAQPQAGLALTASTGIAALNLGGETINALLGFFDTASLQEAYVNGFLTARLGKLWRAGVQRIVLDECSMVAADQLTFLVKAIDEVNGKGYVLDSAEVDDERGPVGMGLTLVGDFAQLSPVKATYAFESPEWSRFEQPGATITLTEIRRQADPDFIEALRAARVGDGRRALDYFGSVIGLQQETDDHFEGPTLLAKNDAVDRYNWLRMSRLPGREVIFPSSRWGKQRSEWGNPEKPAATWGVPERLLLKIGSLVMVLANARTEPAVKGERGALIYVNGDLGTLEEAEDGVAHVRLQRSGEVVKVMPVERSVKIPIDSARRKELRAAGQGERIDGKYEIVGGITYLPLRLAYASTTHKCVAYGTKVAVQGRGVVPIERLQIGDWIDTGTGEYARLKATAHTEKLVWRVTTSSGFSVIASADHRWRTEQGMRATRALRVRKDRLRLQPPTITDGTQVIDRDVAWWLGATVGDANYSDRREGQIHFAGVEVVLRRRWMKIAQRLGGRPNTRKDARGCHLTNLPMRLRLEAWGLDYVTAVSKSTPRIVFEAGRVAWGAYLQGLFDTDGSIDHARLVYATRSPQLADDVQYLLLLLGIPSSRGTYTADYHGTEIEYYHVRVTAVGVDRFKALVGFCYPKKVKALRAWKPNRILRAFDGWDTISKIEPLNVIMPVMDVELESIHELGFNGIVGSNSQGLSLDRVQVNIRDGFFKTPGMLYVALSRARTAGGLRIVGSPAAFIERCASDPRLGRFL